MSVVIRPINVPLDARAWELVDQRPVPAEFRDQSPGVLTALRVSELIAIGLDAVRTRENRPAPDGYVMAVCLRCHVEWCVPDRGDEAVICGNCGDRAILSKRIA